MHEKSTEVPLGEIRVNADDARHVDLGIYYTRGIRFHELARKINIAHPKSLLVIGCGNGYLESILDNSISAVSVDIIEEDLDDARILNIGKANRDFRFANMFDLPNAVEPAKFDAAVISEVIEHVDNDLEALERARQCLNPGGLLFLTVPNVNRFQNRIRQVIRSKPKYMATDHLREYTKQSSIELVKKAGFSVQSLQGLDFWLPKDQKLRWALPYGSSPRREIARRMPSLATWFLLICKANS